MEIRKFGKELQQEKREARLREIQLTAIIESMEKEILQKIEAMNYQNSTANSGEKS